MSGLPTHPSAGGSSEAYFCSYCRTTGPLSAVGACLACGTHARVDRLVSDSGWIELPGAEDLAHIQFGRSHLQVAGNFVPVADFNLVEGDRVWFSHHKLVFVEETVSLTRHNDGKSFFTKLAASMPRVLLSASGPGHLALSDNHAGELVALPLEAEQRMWVRDHVFLAATESVSYEPVANNLMVWISKGNESERYFPLGYYDDIFHARGEKGLLLIHSPGNTMYRDLAPGETTLVKPDALLYRDLTVRPSLLAEKPRLVNGGMFSWARPHLWLSLTGPGRVAISSKYEQPEENISSYNSGVNSVDWSKPYPYSWR